MEGGKDQELRRIVDAEVTEEVPSGKKVVSSESDSPFNIRNKTFTFDDGVNFSKGQETTYVLNDGINHKNLSKVGNLAISEITNKISFLGKVSMTVKTEQDTSTKEFDNEEARNLRIQNFHSAAEVATKSTLGDNDRDMESLLQEVPGTKILAKLLCTEITGFPTITDDNVKVNGLIEVTLSAEEGDINPKISFLAKKGIIDVNLYEYFSLAERSCCCICCNYSQGSALLSYGTSRVLTSQFSVLPVEGTVIDGYCYSNEDVSFKAQTTDAKSFDCCKCSCKDCLLDCIKCSIACYKCLFYCATCKFCDCCTCCDCVPIMDKLSSVAIAFKASEKRLIRPDELGGKSSCTIYENGVKFDISKSFSKDVFVVFYYRSPLDNRSHKCTIKLSDGNFLEGKRFVNLLGKYRSRTSAPIEHNPICSYPVGSFGQVVKKNDSSWAETAIDLAIAARK